MTEFIACSIAFFLYAIIAFKNKVFFPSVIFALMWGLNCLYHVLIFKNIVDPLVSRAEYDYDYMNTYIVYFTAATLIGFVLAHFVSQNKNINLYISQSGLQRAIKQYHWIMWLNFMSGILRIVVMVKLVGFDIYNIIDYRMASNLMMMGMGGGFASIVFRITAYIILLANVYVAVSGLMAGLTKLTFKHTLSLFLLYMPSQLATGGRLFILYFIIFYFGSFLLGRGIAIRNANMRWMHKSELTSILKMALIMVPLVVMITNVRGDGGVKNISSDDGRSALEAFSYITDGTMTTDNCMTLFGGENLGPSSFGLATLGYNTNNHLAFLSDKHDSIYSSSVVTLITPLYLDFGYWGSIVVWMLLAFIIETIGLSCLRKLTILRFLLYAVLLKVCYESIMSNSIGDNIPMFELMILFRLLYKPIFRRFDKNASLQNSMD